MKPWFTVEQIDAATFAISEYQHWEETHCYLLCGTARALLIDTGLGVANIRVVADRLTSLPITVVTTHVHWDHIGGHRYFEHIAVHEAERDWLAVSFPIPAMSSTWAGGKWWLSIRPAIHRDTVASMSRKGRPSIPGISFTAAAWMRFIPPQTRNFFCSLYEKSNL